MLVPAQGSWGLALSLILWVAVARAGNNAPALRLDVPLHFDSAGRYVMNVSMVSPVHPNALMLADRTVQSTSGSYQNFSYTFSTGTGLIYVAGSGGNLGNSLPL
jgi:hypothetical protein